MNRYVVIYYSPAEAMKAMENATPEEKMEGMKPWMAWKESLGDKLVDLGNPLMGGQRLYPDETSKPATNDVTGYSILQAENMEEAKSLLKDHPHLKWTDGCDIEVHECVELM